jgi:HK97 family phage major capsid protein
MKNLKEKRERLQAIDVRLREMADTIAKENRALNDNEQVEKANLCAERDRINLELERAEHPVRVNVEQTRALDRDNAFAEILQSMASNRGIPQKYSYLRASNGGLMIPAVPFTRDGDEPAAGGDEPTAVTVQNSASVQHITPVHMGEILYALKPGEVIGALGLNIQTLQGQWNFPTVAGAEAQWAGENIEISDSTIEIGKISPSPKRLAISVPVSNTAIYQSGSKIREIVLKTINDAVTTAFNVAMLAATHANDSQAPVGALVNASSSNLSAAITRADVLGLMKKVLKTGVKSINPAFVAGSDMFFKLAATAKDAGSGRFLLEDIKNENGILTGVMEGCKVVMSDYVGTNNLAFGAWGYELLGMFGNASLTIDSTSKDVAKADVTYFVLNVNADMLSLRSEAFAILKGGNH